MAGQYIAKADIENRFGKVNVAVWSNLDGGEDADDPRIEVGILFAEADVNNRFLAGRYQIPFAFASGVDPVLKDWCAILAGEWLYTSRGIRDEKAGERIGLLVQGDERTGKLGVDARITLYLSDQSRFNAKRVDTQPSAPVAVLVGG